eukprot:1157534-Pelagomonas_calceolata.AAC.5
MDARKIQANAIPWMELAVSIALHQPIIGLSSVTASRQCQSQARYKQKCKPLLTTAHHLINLWTSELQDQTSNIRNQTKFTIPPHSWTRVSSSQVPYIKTTCGTMFKQMKHESLTPVLKLRSTNY